MNYKKLIRGFFKIPVAEKFIRKHSIHKMYGTGFTKFIALHSEYKSPSKRMINQDGINYQLDISNLVDWYIYFGFKEPEKDRLFSMISKGQTIIDVGANIGDMTLNFAKIAGDNGLVIAFEPFPPMFSKLTQNIALNSFKNIVTQNLGLANATSVLEMEEPSEGNPGMNRITSNSSKNTTQISVVRLDDFLKKSNIQEIHIIKIDVEGYEHEVLKGAQEILTHQRPLLFIELDDANLRDQGSSAQQLIQLLESLNYKMVKATNNSVITSESDFKNCHYDIICTAKQ